MQIYVHACMYACMRGNSFGWKFLLENFVENTCGKLSVEISLREVWCEMFHPQMGAALTLGLGLGGSIIMIELAIKLKICQDFEIAIFRLDSIQSFHFVSRSFSWTRMRSWQQESGFHLKWPQL